MDTDRTPTEPPQPPRLADALVAWFCAPALLEEIQGDLHELFHQRMRRCGLRRARWQYWWDALWFFRPYVLRREPPYEQARGPVMWNNYLKVALRTLRRHKGTAFINVSGLAIGMACCLVVLVFVRDELSYDTYHAHEDRLYRLSIKGVTISSGDERFTATSPLLWAPALQNDYPEVAGYARFVQLGDPANPWRIRHGYREFAEQNILYADTSALDLFSWPLRAGNPATALTEPRSIVLTQAMATRYFGDDDPLSQILTLDPRLRDDDGTLTGETFDFTVTGVLEDLPRRSHFTFDFLLPFSGLNGIFGGDVNTGAGLDSWYWRGRLVHTYLLLREDADPAALEARFPAFIDRYVGDATVARGYYYEPFLQPLRDIYLDGGMEGQLQPVGNRATLYLFSIIALFILLIACINFMNLSTARSAGRAREVGLRKVVGAHRRQIVWQFLGESVLVSLMAFVLALALARLLLPVFYRYLNKDFVLDYSGESVFLLSLLGVGLFVGVVAGSYPAFFLSRFRPVAVLKGAFTRTAGGGLLRKGLVVFQFAISAFLIMATLAVFKQLHFMRTYQLGFDQERVLVIPPNAARSVMPQYEAFRETLLRDPRIAGVTASSGVPGEGGGGDLYVEKGAAAEDGFGVGEVMVDYHFMEMYGLELVAGRTFSRAITTDAGVPDEAGWIREVAAIVNEEAVRRFGWPSAEAALGKEIIRDPRSVDWTATVVGVVKDFHYRSLREEIGPVALFVYPEYTYLSIKLQPGDLPATLAFIEETAQAFAPETPFAYAFLDDAFNAQYQAEERLSEVFSYISFLAIFIACLGLFGLAAFTAEQRTKEIGVRKVLGASVGSLVMLLSRGFVLLVLLAFVLVTLPAYFAIDRWLQAFAYRIDISWEIFLMAGLAALLIALATVSYQALKAALANPADSLRYE